MKTLIIAIAIFGSLFIVKEIYFSEKNASLLIKEKSAREEVKVIEVVERPRWEDAEVQKALMDSIKNRRLEAEKIAHDDLMSWHNTKMRKVDDDFLEWYFDYFNTQGRNFSALWTTITDSEAAAQRKQARDIANQFSARGVSQKDFERVITSTAQKVGTGYLEGLAKDFEGIQKTFEIPADEWQYFESQLVQHIQLLNQGQVANAGGDLTTKAINYSMGSAAVLAGSKISAVAGKTFAAGFGKAAAAKSGVYVAGKVAAAKGAGLIGAKVGAAAVPGIGWAVLGGIALFEGFSHGDYKERERPKMRANISQNMEDILNDAISGTGAIGATQLSIENDLFDAITNNKIQPLG